MKRGTMVFLAVLAVFILFVIVGYNSLVSLNENVNNAWANVENQYERRFDLVPNLVSIVKGYAAHEEVVFSEVANARAGVGSLKVTPEVLKDPELFQKFQEQQDAFGSAISRLLAVSESYPELKADRLFSDLQAQVEGTENRIATERYNYNEASKKYNKSRRSFPANIIASIFGFPSDAKYFKLGEGKEKVPEIKF